MSVKAKPEEEAEARRICIAAADDPDEPSWKAYLAAARLFLADKEEDKKKPRRRP